MKAVFINRYGSTEVLQYGDIETPVIKSDQLLVKVHASSINPIDWKIRAGQLQVLTGYQFPLVLGLDVSGEVVAVGESVTRFQTGDKVYAYLDSLPGGAYAEYVALSERVACLKPDNMSDEQAAAVPLAATTALQALRNQGQILPGQKVSINGASGGVGSFAVQIAKAFKAEVTAICSTPNVELVQSLGADRIIDYTAQDFTKDTSVYDIIFDAVGKQSFSDCQNILQPNGIYVTTLPTPNSLMQSFLTFLVTGKKAKFMVAQSSGQDLAFLKELIEAGKIRSVIERTYPLEELAAAHAHSERGHVVGKLAIAVAS
jgi:2-desacetyl-2-hydroxyethyl bacteriochlorophyllide A dehydrogenase